MYTGEPRELYMESLTLFNEVGEQLWGKSSSSRVASMRRGRAARTRRSPPPLALPNVGLLVARAGRYTAAEAAAEAAAEERARILELCAEARLQLAGAQPL